MSAESKIKVLLITVLTFLIGSSGFNSAMAQNKKMMKAPDFHLITKSIYDFSDTVELLKASIEEQNLMVINEVDPQKMLRLVGVKTKGMRQIFFFHPRYMKRIYETNKLASIEPPLKIVVMEMPNGKVMVRYIRPSHKFNPYMGLNELAAELDELLVTIAKTTTK
ncbi:MAG: DUF302 domain-containing protein [Candidatus Marinimicrobia bacterium]|nr:DUF302 domain-containing protein [Candidatus Neomarinimicrobiota bacterium]